MAAYERDALTFFEKSGLSAAEDERFGSAEDAVVSSALDLFLCHLRKASVGDINATNAHPFHRDGITFCHNGGIKESENLPVYGLEPEGTTDSERFFLNMLGAPPIWRGSDVARSGRTGHRLRPREPPLHVHLLPRNRWKGCCWQWRDFRTELRPDEAPPENFEKFSEYYTLYHSPSARAVSSEMLPALADDWRMIDNRSLIVL